MVKALPYGGRVGGRGITVVQRGRLCGVGRGSWGRARTGEMVLGLKQWGVVLAVFKAFSGLGGGLAQGLGVGWGAGGAPPPHPRKRLGQIFFRAFG